MTHRFLFVVLLSLSSLYGSEEVSSLSSDDIICYNTLKDAFFSERSDLKNVKALFDETFPEPTEEAIEMLGYILPDIEPWQESNPPKTHAIIGQKRISIHGTVGLIIYETRPDSADELEFFQFLLQEIEERELTSGDEVFELIWTTLFGNCNWC
jgi:hypothetical protein